MAGTKPTARGRGNLPAELTTFVGRRRELADVRRQLSRSRLVTLTGVGGVGKTRLAMRMSAEVRRTFPDGVWFVDLAALGDPNLLAYTVANALELRQVSAEPTADLAEYLEDKQLLIVLDNCEQLSEACAVLASKLLAAAPRLRVLATSRHVLGAEGEQIQPVPPLSRPPDGSIVTAGGAAHYESVALFLDRASAVSPGFKIGDQNRAEVLELCRRLEGIPLAIELAAVWTRTLSVAQIVDRLDDRFRLLTGGNRAAPPRQQALDAAVGWSFELCSPAEQVMWGRLSVFSGRFDLEAAEAVCSGDGIARGEVLGLVAGLLSKSVITRQPAGENITAGYHMLETIRQYGFARLAESGQTRNLRLRHRDYYRSLANRFESESFSPRQADWFIRLRREHDNLRIALDFCLTEPGEAPAALEIAAPIWNFWFAGFLREGHRYLVRALGLVPEPTLLRANGLWAAANLALVAGEVEDTRRMLAECEVLAERFGDDLLRARIAECAGHAALYRGDLPGAVALLEEGRSGYRAVGDLLGEFDTLILLAAASFFLDDPRVEEFSRQALALAENQDAASSKAYALWGVGIVQWRNGHYVEATRSLQEAIRLWQPFNDRTGISFSVEALSWCAGSANPDESAATLMGASHAVWRASGAKVDQTTPYSQFNDLSEQRIREAIGDEVFDHAYEEGSAYSFEQAVTLALGRSTEHAALEQTTDASPEPANVLTPREQEIAELLGEGLTNKEIAARLVISPRTAESHVDHILGKLGFASRAQVASWVTEHRAG